MNTVRCFLKKGVHPLLEESYIANRIPIGSWSVYTAGNEELIDGPMSSAFATPIPWSFESEASDQGKRESEVTRELLEAVETIIEEGQSRARDADTLFVTITMYGWTADKRFLASVIATCYHPEHGVREVPVQDLPDALLRMTIGRPGT